MKKKRTKLDPEFEAKLDASLESTTKLLEDRIAYHRAKMAEEQAASAKPARRLRRH
jgi:hypothetical protein